MEAAAQLAILYKNEEIQVKKITIAVLLLFSMLAWAGSEPNAAEYTINVHVSRSHLIAIMAGQTLEHIQRLTVVIDGKKYDLDSDGVLSHDSLVALGDYKAKLVRDEHKSPYESIQAYEVLFPDKKVRKFLVVGQTE